MTGVARLTFIARRTVRFDRVRLPAAEHQRCRWGRALVRERSLPGGRATIFSARTPPHLVRKDLATGAEEELLAPHSFNVAQDVAPDHTPVVSEALVRRRFRDASQRSAVDGRPQLDRWAVQI